MPAFRGGDHHGAFLLDAKRRHGLGFGLRQGLLLDRLPLAIEPVELGGDLCRFDRIGFHQEPHAEIGAADAAAGIDAGPQQKTEMPGFRRAGQPRHIHETDKSRLLAPAQHQQALGDEGAIEPDQRHHVGDGAERHVVEKRQQIGLGPRLGPKTPGAQFAIDRHHGHEHKPDRCEIAQSGEIVAPVRIDDCRRRRQRLVGLMMIDDDDVHAERICFAQRLDAGGAAIDGHQQRRAAGGERPHRLDIRAVAFEQAVGNVNNRLDATKPQEPGQHGGGCRAVDVVVAENRDALAAHNSIGDARCRLGHGGEHIRIGHRAFDGRIEKSVDRVGLDIAAGEDARQQFGNLVALRDRQRARRAALVEPVAPGAAGRRSFDAEEEAILSHGPIVTLSCSAQAGHPVDANAADQTQHGAITGSPAGACHRAGHFGPNPLAGNDRPKS